MTTSRAIGFLCELGFHRVSGQRPAAIAGEETDGDPQHGTMRRGLGVVNTTFYYFKEYENYKILQSSTSMEQGRHCFLSFVENADTQQQH